MTFLRTTVLCLAMAAPMASAKVLAEDVLVLVNSVRGEVVIYLSESGVSDFPVRPLPGDVFVGPLTIETGANSNIDIRVRGNTVSISAGSSVVVDNLSTPQPMLEEQST